MLACERTEVEQIAIAAEIAIPANEAEKNAGRSSFSRTAHRSPATNGMKAVVLRWSYVQRAFAKSLRSQCRQR